MSNQSTKNNDMNDDGMLNAETQRKLPQGKILQPKLRFKGFTDPWQQRKLGELLQVRNGASQKQVEVADGKYPILATGGEIGRTNTPIYCRESVLIGRKGTIDKPVYMNTPFWTVDTLFYTELADEVNGRFVYAMFQTIPWKRFDTSTGVPSLTSSTIHAIKKFTPVKLTEQIRIGEFFRVLDDLIAAAKKKADLLKLKKRYYLQAIFSQQLRFKGFTGSWQQRKLGDLLKFERPDRYIEPDGDYLSKGATPVLTANKGFVLGYTNNPEGIYDKGPCVIFDDFTLDRKLVRCPFKVRSSAIKILTANPSVDLYFMFELLEFQKFPSLGHARHYISVVEPWRTPVPDDLEQTHIGEMFRVMDDLIVAVTRRIELLERQKTAYLQCLFV